MQSVLVSIFAALVLGASPATQIPENNAKVPPNPLPSPPILGSVNCADRGSLPIGDHLCLKERCRHGRFVYNRNDVYIGRSLHEYGEWGENELDLFFQFLRPGDTVFDVGANVGAFTIPFGKAVGKTGQVYAFEPQRYLHRLLMTNVAINELSNIEVLHMAVGDREGKIEVPRVDYRHAANFGSLSLVDGQNSFEIGPDGKGVSTTALVPTEAVTLASLDQMTLRMHHVGSCMQFIKIDVEGMEADVLRGARELLERCKPVLYVENNCLRDSKALIELLFALNYQAFWDVQPLFNPYNFYNNPTNIWDNSNTVSVNMLAVHNEAPFRFDSFAKIERGKWYLHQYELPIRGLNETIVLRQAGTETECVR